jgi:polyhydroxyalkanoate synthesis regulator protein
MVRLIKRYESRKLYDTEESRYVSLEEIGGFVQAWSTGVDQMQQGVDRFLEASMDKLAPIRRARDEMGTLRSRLEELEGALQRLERDSDSGGKAPARKAAPKKAAAKKAAAKKAPARRVAKKTTSKKTARSATQKKV